MFSSTSFSYFLSVSVTPVLDKIGLAEVLNERFSDELSTFGILYVACSFKLKLIGCLDASDFSNSTNSNLIGLKNSI